jgi:hypothetical protein
LWYNEARNACVNDPFGNWHECTFIHHPRRQLSLPPGAPHKVKFFTKKCCFSLKTLFCAFKPHVHGRRQANHSARIVFQLNIVG